MKKRIIIISILCGILIVLSVLFGVVFCLYHQNVKVVGEEVDVSNERILELANLKTGQSIFSIDKDKAIENIEKNEANIKVIQIKTTSINTIEIVVRKRIKTYYCVKDSGVYVFDEELKLLEITDSEPENLIKIDANLLDVENKSVCDFVSGVLNKDLAYSTFVSLMSVCQNKIDGEVVYFTREQVCNFITDLKIEAGYTLNGGYDRLVLKTSFGVEFDIGKPSEDLTRKMNMCYSAMQNLDETRKSAGRIKITYLENGEEHFGYQAE